MASAILTALPYAVGGLVGSKLVKKVFGGKKKEAAAPAAPTGPAVMPTPDDEQIRLARKRAIVSQMSRRGRQSTILTPQPGSTLGG